MDARYFDRLTRSLTEAGTRRGLLGLLATLPFLSGLVALLDRDETDAKGRRRRRKKPHHHRKKTGNRAGKKKKRRCQPESKTTTCSAKCGSVLNNCKKTVDCGSCDCPEPCDPCEICQSGPNTPGTCVPDPDKTGDPCGEATCSDGTVTAAPTCTAGGICHPGVQASCDPYTQCDGTKCPTSCGSRDDCVDGFFCNQDRHCVEEEADGEPCEEDGQCASGHCVNEVCCVSASCPACQACNLSGDGTCTAVDDGATCDDEGICCAGDCVSGVCCADSMCSAKAPDCEDHQCTCDGGAACAGDPELCCDAECVDTDTSHDHCGSCDHTCEADEVCLDGVCKTCDVTCTGTPAECGAALQAALNAPGPDATIYVCPGIYQGGFSLPADITVIGAGQGDDKTVDTILDGNDTQRVVEVVQFASQAIVLARLRIRNGRRDSGAGLQNIAGSNRTTSLIDCTITGNTAVREGAGIFSSGGASTKLTRCTVSFNTVNHPEVSGFGGGIDHSGSGKLTLTNCLIADNTARTAGGGITVGASDADLINCQVTRNIRLVDNEAGGGISFDTRFTHFVTLTDTFVWDNTEPDCSGPITIKGSGGCGAEPPTA